MIHGKRGTQACISEASLKPGTIHGFTLVIAVCLAGCGRSGHTGGAGQKLHPEASHTATPLGAGQVYLPNAPARSPIPPELQVPAPKAKVLNAAASQEFQGPHGGFFVPVDSSLYPHMVQERQADGTVVTECVDAQSSPGKKGGARHAR